MRQKEQLAGRIFELFFNCWGKFLAVQEERQSSRSDVVQMLNTSQLMSSSIEAESTSSSYSEMPRESIVDAEEASEALLNTLKVRYLTLTTIFQV